MIFRFRGKGLTPIGPLRMQKLVARNGTLVLRKVSSQRTDTQRNFELPRVKSINTSGHKFGLVYAGVGWIIWRDECYLPKHLIFELHYLGGTEESYTLNFSRPGAQVIAQYYNLIHLGFEGYRAIMENCMVRYLAGCGQLIRTLTLNR